MLKGIQNAGQSATNQAGLAVAIVREVILPRLTQLPSLPALLTLTHCCNHAAFAAVPIVILT